MDDAANTVRFLDTKAGAVFVGISISISVLQLSAEKIQEVIRSIQGISKFFQFGVVLIICYVLMVCLSLVYCFKTIKPKYLARIDMGQYDYKELWYIKFGNLNEKQIVLNDYYSTFKYMTKKDCILSLVHEHLKLSYIREQKTKNLNKSIFCFVFSLIVLGLFCVYISMISLVM
jgi:hypothetical protein